MLILFSAGASSSEKEFVLTEYFASPFADGTYYSISSGYGWRRDVFGSNQMGFHNGLDLGASRGTDILASADGVVVETGYLEESSGYYVYIKHDIVGTTYYSVYGHMLEDSIIVKVGDYVKQGDKIGCVGKSGKTTGYHLHFTITSPELKFDTDNLIDPTSIFDGLKVGHGGLP